MEKYISISKAAKLIGVNKETLRRWDKDGKFKSSRNPINNYRVYSIERITSFIKDLELDYTTENIPQILNPPVFKTEFGSLYNIDVLHFLRSVENESVD